MIPLLGVFGARDEGPGFSGMGSHGEFGVKGFLEFAGLQCWIFGKLMNESMKGLRYTVAGLRLKLVCDIAGRILRYLHLPEMWTIVVL